VFGQPPVLVAAFAAGVLMFFSPCSVGLLPAYLTYFLSAGNEEPAAAGAGGASETSRSSVPSPAVAGIRRGVGVAGVVLFLAGAVPLFYMAVAGIRILLPGYTVLVPLARLGTGSYLPAVLAVTVGAILGVNLVATADARRGLRVGALVTVGIAATYAVVGAPVVAFGRWLEPVVSSLELLAGPLLVALGVLYYLGVGAGGRVSLPERDASMRGFLEFGVLYAVGSLACNLPVFLGVVVSEFAAAGVATGVGVFVAFVAGMGTTMVALTTFVAATGRTVSLGRHTGRVRLAGSVAFVLVGGYVTWYSLTAFGYL